MNLTLRLGAETYKKLKELSLKEERSINGEINYIIRKYIENIDNKEKGIISSDED